MLFTSVRYLIFLAVVFLLYWPLASKRWARVLLLLVASYYFYALWSPRFLAVLFLISTVDFLVARALGATERQKPRKLLLGISLLSDVGALVLFKYFNFLSASLAEVLNKFGRQTSPVFLARLALPLGLSFITFRSISYVIDVYRKTTKPTKNYLEYLLFVAFFPTVIAGPLVRAKELLLQFSEWASLTSEDRGRAIFLIMLGLAKKIAIANFLAKNLVDRVFDQPQLYSSVETLAAIYGYALQIYCDFSGYTDIAIGSAMLLGFKLPVNFNSPYRAQSLIDFWRRWHITLSEWLRDYVYMSIGGLLKRRFNSYRNLMITMLVAGLWHGAAWTFVLWGGLHGVGLAMNHWWDARRRKRKQKPRQTWWIKAACVFTTFHFVCLGWVLFRAGSLRRTWEVLRRLGALEFAAGNLALPVLTVLVLGYLSHWVPRRVFDKVSDGWNWLPLPAQAVVILGVALGLYYVSSANVQFIYGNF
jgi:D-alanyl-lipoteichoic acid acyltransferase DltB (MBOAT superfamily)